METNSTHNSVSPLRTPIFWILLILGVAIVAIILYWLRPVDNFSLNKIDLYPPTMPVTEDELLLEITELPNQSAVEEANNCQYYLFSGGKTLKGRAGTISIKALASMVETATNIAVPAGSSLTAIKLKYGFENNKIKLYYVPMRLYRESYGSAQGDTVEHGVYKVYEDPGLYDLNAASVMTKLIGAALTAAETAIKNYTVYTKIVHSHGSEPTGLDPKDDVTAAIFPLQELYSVAQNTITPGTDSLIFWNGVKAMPKGTGKVFKHILIISSNQASPFIEESNEDGKFANLSHMCPPSCNVTHLLYQLNKQ